MELKRRSLSGMLVFIGCITLMTVNHYVRSQELTVRSGTRNITVRPGKPDDVSHTLTANDLAEEMLNAHNDIRSRIDLPPLQWSEELATYSQKWANSLMTNNRIAHNSNSPYGENIIATGLGATPTSVVNEWASESQSYTYITNTCDGECGHYTQLVWRSTREVGCAMAQNNQREIWVCSYDPPGNYRGEWPY